MYDRLGVVLTRSTLAIIISNTNEYVVLVKRPTGDSATHTKESLKRGRRRRRRRKFLRYVTWQPPLHTGPLDYQRESER